MHAPARLPAALPGALARALLLGTVVAAATSCSRSDDEVERRLAQLRAGDPAGAALADLGREHEAGLPAVIETIRADERRAVLIPCLEALLSLGAGEDARPAVDHALRNRDPVVANRAALVHWKLFGEPEPGLARLVERAPSDPVARQLLRRAPPLPAELAAELAADADLDTLAALGPAVAAAQPRVEAALEGGNADLRIRAAYAHFRLSGRLQPALATLEREFRAENLFLRQRIHAIWLEMREAQPEAMDEALARWEEGEDDALRSMARAMRER